MIRVAIFLLVCATSAFVAWCGGFDFDRRTPDVALWAFVTIIVAIWIAAIPEEYIKSACKKVKTGG